MNDRDHLRPAHSLEPSASSSSAVTLAGESDNEFDCRDEVEEQLVKPTPLPKLQLFIAIFIQVAEPVTCTVIYPFVNDLIRSMGITHGDETKTGYYAGLVESVFYAAECLTVMHWGRASDIIGRKPILLGGMAGLCVSMFGFGLSKAYWMLILSRCLQGAFNGNVGVTKSVMAEITDESNRPQAFAFLPVAWSVGSTLGPAIGGGFTNPAERWPEVFGSDGFFSRYPYFLPCVVAALVPLCAFLLASIALKETAPNVIRKRRLEEVRKEGTASPLLEGNHNYGSTGTLGRRRPRSIDSLTDSSENDALLSSDLPPTKPSFRSIFIPQVLIPISNFGFLAFLDQSVLVLLPLVYSTPISLGGLSMSPSTIGSILGIWGVINGFFQVFCFAWVRRFLGHRRTYMVGVGGMGVVFALFPVLNALARAAGGDGDEGRVGVWVWAGIALQLGIYSFSYMSYACMFLYVAASAPNKSSLGTTNGLAQLTASGVRALAPTMSSSLFSLSLGLAGRGGLGGWLGARMVYIVLNVITVAALAWSLKLPKELREARR